MSGDDGHVTMAWERTSDPGDELWSGWLLHLSGTPEFVERVKALAPFHWPGVKVQVES